MRHLPRRRAELDLIEINSGPPATSLGNRVDARWLVFSFSSGAVGRTRCAPLAALEHVVLRLSSSARCLASVPVTCLAPLRVTGSSSRKCTYPNFHQSDVGISNIHQSKRTNGLLSNRAGATSRQTYSAPSTAPRQNHGLEAQAGNACSRRPIALDSNSGTRRDLAGKATGILQDSGDARGSPPRTRASGFCASPTPSATAWRCRTHSCAP